MIYEELIKKLRNRRVCIQNGGDLEADFPLMKEAADAIEKLQAAVSGYEATTDVEFVKEDGHERIRFVPKWIPVTERLPETPGEYMVAYHPCYWDRVNDEIKVGLDSFRGKTSWAKKKYQRVTHWMPLPEPPKEET